MPKQFPPTSCGDNLGSSERRSVNGRWEPFGRDAAWEPWQVAVVVFTLNPSVKILFSLHLPTRVVGPDEGGDPRILD